MKARAVCPKNPDHNQFIVTAHVVQEWRVNELGEFIKCTVECTDILHHPDRDDVWICAACGEEVREFKED